MSQARLLVGSNDVGLRGMAVLQKAGLAAAGGELGYSGDQIQRIRDENVEVRIVPLESLIPELETTTKAGLGRLDGVAMMSCRPYGSGRELDDIRRRIRALPDICLAFPEIPARNVPIVISDLKHALAGRPLPGIAADPWTSLVPPGGTGSIRDIASELAALPKRTTGAWYDACRKWRADLVEDLELGGLVVARGADGNIRPRVALRRRTHGGRMHLPGFEPAQAYKAGLPIFLVDVDLEREPFSAFHELCTDSFSRYARTDRSKGEIVLHRFLDENPVLLNSETYRAFLTETCFAIRNGHRLSLRTDLILQPANVAESKHVIAELKRPDVNVYREDGGGIRLTRAVLRAIAQVLSYRERLLDPANEEEVRRRLRRPPPRDYELAVVIGLRPSGESPDTAASLRAQALTHGVHLIRFDELSQFGMKLMGAEGAVGLL